MTTNYIYYIIYATITNFDIFTTEDHLICLSKCLSNKFCNIGFNIFTKWWVVPDDIYISSGTYIYLLQSRCNNNVRYFQSH